ncbi:MAG: hypothetical protein U1B80_03520 [Anaerolineaceae bacterium]|nr:hypothetical protein [Anaerolineaceae bacterium]
MTEILSCIVVQADGIKILEVNPHPIVPGWDIIAYLPIGWIHIAHTRRSQPVVMAE